MTDNETGAPTSEEHETSDVGGEDATTETPAAAITGGGTPWWRGRLGLGLAAAVLLLVGMGAGLGASALAQDGRGDGDHEQGHGVVERMAPPSRPDQDDQGFTQAQRPQLGVQVSDSTDPSGAMVEGVAVGSAAESAGIKTGDVITSVDNTAVTDAGTLAALIQDAAPGTTLKVSYARGGAKAIATVTLPELVAPESGTGA